MGTYDGKTGGVGGGAMVDLLHEGTVLRESENEIIDQFEGTVRTDRQTQERDSHLCSTVVFFLKFVFRREIR